MAVWLLVLVVCGTAVLLGPVWTEIAEHATLAYLLEVASSNREYLGRVATVVMAVTERAPSQIASLHQPIASFYSIRDRFVKYVLTMPAAESSKNFFSILMASNAPNHLPKKYETVRNNKLFLFNDVALLAENNVGFRGDEVGGIGITFTNSLTSRYTVVH